VKKNVCQLFLEKLENNKKVVDKTEKD